MLRKIVTFFILFIFTISLHNLLGQHDKHEMHEKHDKQTKHMKQKMQKHKVKGYSHVEIDPRRVQILGITTEKIMYRKLEKNIRTVGVVHVDETRIAHIQTKFKGWIEELYANFIGMEVATGQPLFSVYSPQLVATQEEYLSALQNFDKGLDNNFSKSYMQSSENIIAATQDRLRLFDISQDQIDELQDTREAFKTLIFRSPIDGIILDKKAFIGMHVAPGLISYSIANLSHIWVLADIYEDNIDLIKLGQTGKIEFNALPNKIFRNKVTFIDYVVDGKTRTAKARFEIENRDFKLKPGMFATVNLKVKLGTSLALPQEALINTGPRKIVFVQKDKGHFEPREIKIGFKAGTYYQVISGLQEGEMVITSGQFLIDSESRLKALEGSGMRGHGH